MPELQPIYPPQVAAIVRPGCPKCQYRPMLLSKLEAHPASVTRHSSARNAAGFGGWWYRANR